MQRTFQQNADNFFRYCSVMSNAHYDLAEMYACRHRRFGTWVVVLSTIVGTGAFISVAKADGADLWLKISAGLLSIAASVLSALQTFLGFSEKQTQHKRAGDGYSVARRDLDFLLMKFPGATGAADEPATVAFESIKRTLDDLDKASPTIPDSVYDAASNKTPTSNAP